VPPKGGQNDGRRQPRQRQQAAPREYGNHLFGAWVASGTTMVGQVLDAGTGAAIGSSVPIAVPSNQFQDFRDYSDGGAAYVAPGSSASKIKIVRVLPCKD
jgi:hypothetical protein